MTRLTGGPRAIAVVTAIVAVGIALTWTLAATSSASSAASPAGAKPTAAASAPRCAASDLGVWVATNQTNVAAGTQLMPIEFTNLSRHTCTLEGFPGVSAIGANGKQLGSPAVWVHAVKATLVKLVPSATGYAMLAYSDVVTSNCPSASKRAAAELRVYAPGETNPDYAFWSLETCTAPGQTSFLRVRVIAPGIGVLGDLG